MQRQGSAGHIESLESRQLLSAAASLADGRLTITGDNANDVIVISLNAQNAAQLDVRLGKATTSYTAANIRRIDIDAMGGNDKITVREKAGRVLIDMVVNGGDGNDTIVTGSGNDMIDAGAGNDKVSSGSGDDYIFGGEGNDNLLGGSDNDQIDAGAGKDKLSGDAGNDNIDGGGGKDNIKAGLGDDRLAIDDTNAKEVRLKGGGDITQYNVTTVGELPPQLLEALDGLDEELPGFQVFRAEAESETGYYSIYYRFGNDPDPYKLVLSVINNELELVTRQVSLEEARESAHNAFNDDHPNSGVVSLFQHPGNVWDVRYRDADGEIQSVTTDDIIWGIDDLESDQDNDGRRDPVDNNDPNH